MTWTMTRMAVTSAQPAMEAVKVNMTEPLAQPAEDVKMANKQKGKSGRTLQPFSVEMRRQIREFPLGHTFSAQDFYALAVEHDFNHRSILPGLRVFEHLHKEIKQISAVSNAQGRPRPVFIKMSEVACRPIRAVKSIWDI